MKLYLIDTLTETKNGPVAKKYCTYKESLMDLAIFLDRQSLSNGVIQIKTAFEYKAQQDAEISNRELI